MKASRRRKFGESDPALTLKDLLPIDTDAANVPVGGPSNVKWSQHSADMGIAHQASVLSRADPPVFSKNGPGLT
jgi:hypothetical protein